MPPQQNYNQTPQPGMPAQGNNIFAPQPSGSGSPKKPSKLPVFLAAVFIISTLGFAVLAFNFYGQMTSYRDDYEKRAAVDIAEAKKAQEAELTAKFNEESKSPYRTYQTQSSAASIKVVFPKTWDLYAEEDNTKGIVSNWFNENYVSDTGNKDTTYSLRLEYIDRPYATVAKTFDGDAKKGTISITPYKVQGVNGETGVKIDGEVRQGITGSMIIIPIRDKTMQLWTESDRYVKDFNEVVLKNLTYSP